MTVYYNEIDPGNAEWLRQLIKIGVIAPGYVDERSIIDISPIELTDFCQVHLFAGTGAWSYALKQAGWGDEKPVWTGSCPCQPFSQAGKRKGSGDERDLWWAMFWLIQQCRPPTVFGEQVASTAGLEWWDTVSSDLEGADYACTTVDLCAASVGAPHIRQRLFWVANTDRPGRQWARSPQSEEGLTQAVTAGGGAIVRVADSPSSERGSQPEGRHERNRENPRRGQAASRSTACRSVGDVANSQSSKCQLPREAQTGGTRPADCGGVDDAFLHQHREISEGRSKAAGVSAQHWAPVSGTGESGGTGSSANFWSEATWLPCRDGKARPAKPGICPLVDGIAPDLVRGGDTRLPNTENTSEARALRLKGYGNAIVAPLAIAFIQAYMEI